MTTRTGRIRDALPERAYRDAWLLIISIFVAYTAWQTMESVDRISESRRTALFVTCGAVNAVIDTGRETMARPPRYPPRVERNLVRLGFPSYPQRRRRAHVAADRYARSIARSVADNAGFTAANLVRHDGTIDCAAFARLVRPTD